jgi:hypothetical protein
MICHCGSRPAPVSFKTHTLNFFPFISEAHFLKQIEIVVSPHPRLKLVFALSMVGRSQMPTNHNPATTSRTAKRKAESSPQEEDPPTTQTRPQRKKQKQQPTKQEEDTSPSASPVARTRGGGNESALTKHLLGLFNEIKKSVDNEYVSLAFGYFV